MWQEHVWHQVQYFSLNALICALLCEETDRSLMINFCMEPAVAVCVALVALTVCMRQIVQKQRKRSSQGVVPGLPWLGNTISLALQGASFIHRCKLQVSMRTCHKHRAHANIRTYSMISYAQALDWFTAWKHLQAEASRPADDIPAGSREHQAVFHSPR